MVERKLSEGIRTPFLGSSLWVTICRRRLDYLIKAGPRPVTTSVLECRLDAMARFDFSSKFTGDYVAIILLALIMRRRSEKDHLRYMRETYSPSIFQSNVGLP
jgi:hypothetical protein